MTIGIPPICIDCKHYIPDPNDDKPMYCSAFPDGIPGEIIKSESDHHNSHPNDHGIQFEQKT
jgi:hypothetical protein